jgi:hypothetical protein
MKTYMNGILGVAQVLCLALLICTNSALKRDGQTFTLTIGKPDERPAVNPELAQWLISDKALKNERQQQPRPIPSRNAHG